MAMPVLPPIFRAGGPVGLFFGHRGESRSIDGNEEKAIPMLWMMRAVAAALKSIWALNPAI
jgi:hypothetical protein